MQRCESECVPLDSSREPIQKGQQSTVDDVDIHQMAIRRTGIRTVGNHRHHYVVVLLKLRRQHRRHQREERDIHSQYYVF